MRKGYWRTLTRQMRDKVAAGENTFVCADGTITIMAAEADADADLDQGQTVLLARDTEGRQLILDTANSTVLQLQDDGTRLLLAPDLISFVNALCAGGPIGLTLSDAVGEPLDFPVPRRGILDDVNLI